MRGARLALLLLVAGTSCALPLPWRVPHLRDCPGPLAPVEAIPGGDFVLRERARFVSSADHPDRRVDVGLELVAERRGDQLTLVGLNPFGAKVFSAVQRGLHVQVDARGPLPVPPADALRDLHAARFLPQDPAERERRRVVVARPGCGYSATFVRIERRALP